MRNNSFGPRHSFLFLAAATLAIGACVSTKAPERSGAMAQAESVTASTYTVVAQVNELTTSWLRAVEWRGDVIRGASDDPVVRRNALLWKINGTGAMLEATSHADPLIALLDAWTLVLQFRDYFDGGPGAEMFGEQTAGVRELLAAAEDRVELVVASVALPEGVDRGRRIAREFATREPIVNAYFLRHSVAGELLTAFPPEQRDAFASIGSITQTVEGLGARVAIYANHLPRIARWQAELLLEDPATEAKLAGVIEDVDSIDATAERLADTLDRAVDVRLDEVLDEALAQVGRELDDLERLVNAQRQLVLDQLPSEYERIFEKVTEQRLAALAQVDSKIDEALDRVEAVADRSLDDASGITRDTVDYAFERATPLLIGAFFGLLILILVYRLVPQRVRQD